MQLVTISITFFNYRYIAQSYEMILFQNLMVKANMATSVSMGKYIDGICIGTHVKLSN